MSRRDNDLRSVAKYWPTWWVMVALIVALAPAMPASASDLSVTQINQVSSTRVGRTLFDYTYTINVANSGPTHTNVVATVTSTAPSTTILQGTVALGTVAGGGSVVSTATFTMQQDRSVLFNPSSLVWQFAYDPTLLPPVITSSAVTATQADGSYQYGVMATDPQGDKLTYALLTAPAGMTIDPVAGVITWSPGFSQAGTSPVTVQVTDLQGLSATQSFSIVVSPAPGPTILPVADATVTIGSTLRIQLVASGSPGSTLKYSFTPALANASLSATGAFVFTPVAAQVGDVPLIFSVTDGIDKTQTGATIHIRQGNLPPQITSTPVATGAEGLAYSYAMLATDPQGEALEYSLSTAPGGMSIDPKTGVISWTPAAGQAGVRSVDVRVTNALGLTTDQIYVITVSTSVDRIPPNIRIQAPTTALINSTVTAEAIATDNVGVTHVTWYVNGAQVSDQTSAPYSTSYTAPATSGQSLTFKAVAFDAAGNSTSATAQVSTVATPDTTPPVIADVLLPAAAAPGETVTVHADVSDNWGVASVAFSNGTTPFGTASVAPYDARLTIPTSALVGSTVTVSALALDTSGNQASAQSSLTVVATPSTTAPTSVTVSAPPNVLPGQTVLVSGSGVDGQGIFKIGFFVDGAQFAESYQAPYQVSFTVPPTTAVGRQFNFVANAIDFDGRTTASAPTITEVVSAQQGTIEGAVYDDSTGLPLPGVTVSVLAAGNRPVMQPNTTVSDAIGKFQFQVAQGSATLSYRLGGYTTAYRAVPVSAGTLNVSLDARLLPLAAGTQINPLATSKLTASDGTTVSIDPGSIATADTLELTTLTGQSLPGPLPTGWAPIAAYEIAPTTERPFAPFHVAVGKALGLSDIAAVWDAVNRQWTRVDAASSNGSTTFSVPGGGAFALVRADTQPQSPAIPTSGQPLAGVVAAAIPVGATAQILPSPTILFLQPGAKSAVSAALSVTNPLPSGTPIKVDFSEYYQKNDGTRLIPPGNSQDLLLYQTTNGFAADFTASPSQNFDPSLLQSGLINLAARVGGNADGEAIIGSAGGTVTSTSGATVTAAAGAFIAATPVHITPVNGTPAGVAADSRFTFIGGVSIDLGGATPQVPLGLSISVATSVTNAAQLFWVRPVQIGSNSGLLLVGLATLSNGQATLSGGGTGLPLPLANSGGAYYLLQSAKPFGFVTGQVTGVTSQAFVNIGDLPIVGQASTGMPAYAGVALLGTTAVNAYEPSTSATATGSVNVTSALSAVVQNLALQAGGFTVTSTTPANGATNIPVASSVAVRFSLPVDSTTATAGNISVVGPSGMIAGAVNVSADGRTISFTPTAPLPGGVAYTVRVAASIRAATGAALNGNQPDRSYISSFNAVSLTPPPSPAAGLVNVQFTSPTRASIIGSAGAAAPGETVAATDATTGATTSVVAGADGSFTLNVALTPGDKITLTLTDPSGNSSTPVPVTVPVVPVQLALTPGSVLFVTSSGSQALAATATFSDGSSRQVQLADGLIFTTANPAIAAVDGTGLVTAGVDGTTTVTAKFAQNGISQSATASVTTSVAGIVVLSATVGPAGARLSTADGSFTISIPKQALTSTAQLAVSRLQLPAGTTVTADDDVVSVLAAYRFEPELNFTLPVTMAFKVPAGGSASSSYAVYRAPDENPNYLSIDSRASDDTEGVTQFFDADLNTLVVSTDAFSYRFLTATASEYLGQPTTQTGVKPLLTDGGQLLQVYDKPGKFLDGASKSIYCATAKLVILPPSTASACDQGTYLVNKLKPTTALKDVVVWHHTTASLPIRIRITADLSAVAPTQNYYLRLSQTPAPESAPGDPPNTSADTFFDDGTASECLDRTMFGSDEYIKTNSATAVSIVIYRAASDSKGACMVPAAGQSPIGTLSFSFGPAPGPLVFSSQSIGTSGERFTISGSFLASSANTTTEAGLIKFEQKPGEAAGTTPHSGGATTAYVTGPQLLVDGSGNIVRFYDLNIVTNHAPPQEVNDTSVGIEIINSGHQYDFYPGPELDGVLRLTDYLISDPALPPNPLPGLSQSTQVPFRQLAPVSGSAFIGALSNEPNWGGLPGASGIATGGIFELSDTVDLAAKQAVVRHRDTDRDYNTDDTGAANGTPFRRADVSGSNFNMEAMTAALRYDFPGTIITQGGDLRIPQSSADVPGNAGHVAIVYGLRPEGVSLGGPKIGPPVYTSNGLGCNGGPVADSLTLIKNLVITGQSQADTWLNGVCAKMKANSFAGLTPTAGSGTSTAPARVFNKRISGAGNLLSTLRVDLDPNQTGLADLLAAHLNQLGSLTVDGELILDAPVAYSGSSLPTVTLTVSGMFYLAPTGIIRGRISNPTGSCSPVNLRILAAGPVVIHGKIDLSGCAQVLPTPSNSVTTAATDGGSLEIFSRALAPLQVPTVIATGGSVGAVGYQTLSGGGFSFLTPPAGKGGDVTIIGAPNGQIWVSGGKAALPTSLPCNYQPIAQPALTFTLPQDSDLTMAHVFAGSATNVAGLQFPTPSVPLEAKYYSDLVGVCSGPAGSVTSDTLALGPEIGMFFTQGRGIITSGGNGASNSINGQRPTSGGAGGNGGTIAFSFPAGHEGAIRFRDVSLLTGGATGNLRKKAVYTAENGVVVLSVDPQTRQTVSTFSPPTPVQVPFVQTVGGAGGSGTLGSTSAVGGDGGAGGVAGDIVINPNARIAAGDSLEQPSLVVCSTQGPRNQATVGGHAGGIPFIERSQPNRTAPLLKSDVDEFIALRTSFCASYLGAEIPLVTLNLATEYGTTTSVNGTNVQTNFSTGLLTGLCKSDQAGSNNIQVKPAPCLVGGSGGLPGGSTGFLNGGLTQGAFDALGTAGRFGQLGGRGNLTMPPSLWLPVSKQIKSGNSCASAAKCP